jgi:C4-dicarboxylate transporter DctM subunit
MLSYNFFANIAKFPLLAIPFFILAGIIMEKVGIAERIVGLIKQIVGDITGGLAVATVIVAAFWGAVSGSGPATVAAIGLILIPSMAQAGYDKAFATATVSVASGLAIIIPPSISFIVYGDIMQQSVGAMFAAGVIPGFVVAGFLCVTVYLFSRRYGYKGQPRGNASVVLKSLRDAFWGLMTPVIILGGIYGGVFTPTEAAAVAAFYGMFVGLFVYRTLTFRVLYDILRESVVSTSVVMLVVACAGLYSWLGATVGLIDKIAGILLSVSTNPTVILLMINIILLFAGMLLDANSIMYIFLPILIPIIRIMNWNPIWFGVMMTVNLAIGQVTPPVAVNLFVGARISGLTMEQIARPAIPLVIAAILALAVLCVFPALTTFLPTLMKLM